MMRLPIEAEEVARVNVVGRQNRKDAYVTEQEIRHQLDDHALDYCQLEMLKIHF